MEGGGGWKLWGFENCHNFFSVLFRRWEGWFGIDELSGAEWLCADSCVRWIGMGGVFGGAYYTVLNRIYRWCGQFGWDTQCRGCIDLVSSRVFFGIVCWGISDYCAWGCSISGSYSWLFLSSELDMGWRHDRRKNAVN